MVDVEREKRLQFLWSTAHHYVSETPALSASLMNCFGQLLDTSSEGVTDAVKQRFCPSCNVLVTPSTCRLQTLSARKLKAKRTLSHAKNAAIEWLISPTSKGKHYVVLHCKICAKTFVVGACAKPAATKATKLRPQDVPTTPKCAPPPTKSYSGKRKATTLKSMLSTTARLQEQRSQQLAFSPNLQDFLQSLN
ncbi:hypothetical protein EMCRGX_G013896 [Ephydatia muelleri]